MKTTEKVKGTKRSAWIFLSLIIVGLTWGILFWKDLKLNKMAFLLKDKLGQEWFCADAFTGIDAHL